MKLSNVLARLRAGLSTPSTRLAAVYLAGALLIAAGYLGGIVGPLFRASGFVGPCVVAIAVMHALGAFRIVSRLSRTGDYTEAEAGSSWLEKGDGVILGLGFLGKIYGIATALAAIGGTGDKAAAMAGIATLTHAISSALFSTFAGLAVSLWTHCATLIVSNFVAAERENPLNVGARVLSKEEWEAEDRRIQAYHHLMDHGPRCCGAKGAENWDQPIQDAEFIELKKSGDGT